jgi:hypothetical protein
MSTTLPLLYMPLPLSNRSSLVFTSLGTLTRTAALPQENVAARLPTASSTERTAVCAFQDTNTLSFDAVSGSVLTALLIRDPVVPLWVQATLVAGSIGYTSAALQAIIPPLLADAPLAVALQIDTPLSFAGSSPLSSYPGGLTPIAVDSTNGYNYFWYPGGSGFLFLQVTSPSIPGGFLVATLNRWVSPGSESPTQVSISLALSSTAATALSSSLVGSGWYRLAELRTGGAPTSLVLCALTVGWTTGSSSFTPTGSISGLVPFALPVEWKTSYLPFQNTRPTASSALFTNITQVLAKQGTALAARLEPTDDYFNTAVFPSVVVTRMPSEKYFGALENGLYSFTSPALESLDFLNHTIQSTAFAAGVTPYLHLDHLGPVNAFVFTDPGTSPYGSLAVTTDWHAEFRTNSSLFQTAVCLTPLEVQHQADIALGTIPNFYENAMHHSQVLSGVAKASSFVSKLTAGTPVGMGLSMVARVANSLNSRAMSQATMVKPKAKRAQANVPKARKQKVAGKKFIRLVPKGTKSNIPVLRGRSRTRQ